MRSTQDLDFQLKVTTFCGVGFTLCYVLAVIFNHFGWSL
jgi:hypothetical protein